MARQTGTRKCDYCKELISVKNKNKLDNVLRYKNKFYQSIEINKDYFFEREGLFQYITYLLNFVHQIPSKKYNSIIHD